MICHYLSLSSSFFYGHSLTNILSRKQNSLLSQSFCFIVLSICNTFLKIITEMLRGHILKPWIWGAQGIRAWLSEGREIIKNFRYIKNCARIQICKHVQEMSKK